MPAQIGVVDLRNTDTLAEVETGGQAMERLTLGTRALETGIVVYFLLGLT